MSLRRTTSGRPRTSSRSTTTCEPANALIYGVGRAGDLGPQWLPDEKHLLYEPKKGLTWAPGGSKKSIAPDAPGQKTPGAQMSSPRGFDVPEVAERTNSSGYSTQGV